MRLFKQYATSSSLWNKKNGRSTFCYLNYRISTVQLRFRIQRRNASQHFVPLFTSAGPPFSHDLSLITSSFLSPVAFVADCPVTRSNLGFSLQPRLPHISQTVFPAPGSRSWAGRRSGPGCPGRAGQCSKPRPAEPSRTSVYKATGCSAECAT